MAEHAQVPDAGRGAAGRGVPEVVQIAQRGHEHPVVQLVFRLPPVDEHEDAAAAVVDAAEPDAVAGVGDCRGGQDLGQEEQAGVHHLGPRRAAAAVGDAVGLDAPAVALHQVQEPDGPGGVGFEKLHGGLPGQAGRGRARAARIGYRLIKNVTREKEGLEALENIHIFMIIFLI